MDEIWCPIFDFETYSVSSEGRIRNDNTGRLVSVSFTLQGEAKVGLYYEGMQHVRSVKVLVADTFVEGKTPIFNTPVHLDNNKTNNHVFNLVWRPRWFAHKYTRQFAPPIGRAHHLGPVENLVTEERHETVVTAGMHDGVLFGEIHKSAREGSPVFPDWYIYSFTRRK